jgi:hypothetical protein
MLYELASGQRTFTGTPARRCCPPGGAVWASAFSEGGKSRAGQPQSDRMIVLRMFVLKVAGALVVTAFLYWAAYAWPVLPFGSGLFTGISLFLPLISLAAAGGLVFTLFGILKSDSRQRASRRLALAAAVLVGTIGGVWLGPIHRMARIEQVVASAVPLARAIEAFEHEEGRPPRQLSELIPRYPAIPSTGMGGYSEWDYITGIDARPYGDNSWVLRVYTSGPGVNFDQLMHFPNQRYPQFGHGGWIERVGGWAYVHE